MNKEVKITRFRSIANIKKEEEYLGIDLDLAFQKLIEDIWKNFGSCRFDTDLFYVEIHNYNIKENKKMNNMSISINIHERDFFGKRFIINNESEVIQTIKDIQLFINRSIQEIAFDLYVYQIKYIHSSILQAYKREDYEEEKIKLKNEIDFSNKYFEEYINNKVYSDFKDIEEFQRLIKKYIDELYKFHRQRF